MINTGKRKHLLFQIAAILSGLFIAAIAGEILLRFMGIGYGNAPLVSDLILHHRNPQNYIFMVHDPAGEYGGHTIYYDEEGLSSDPILRNSPKKSDAKQRVAFMGDSFTVAVQVPYSDSFVGRLNKSCTDDVLIKNYGTSSYSPIIYLLQWENRTRFFKPTHVFLLLHSGDMSDDEAYAKKAVYSKDGKIIACPGPGDDWLKINLRRSYLARFMRKTWLKLEWVLVNRKRESRFITGGYIEENPAISKLSAGCVLELAGKIKRSGGRLTLMATPSKYRLREKTYDIKNPEFSDKWKRWAEENSIDFLDLTKAFRAASDNGTKLFFERDIHFNKNGNEIIADCIRKNYPEYFYQK